MSWTDLVNFFRKRNCFIPFVIIFLFLSQLQAAPKYLKKEDIHRTMDELFTVHVEYKELTPTIVKRSFKVFIENFDPAKIYLLHGEVKPFLDLTPAQLSAIIDRYYNGDFSDYERLNQVIGQAIKRARAFRKELKNQVQPSQGEFYASYAKDTSQLKSRIVQQYGYFLAEEKAEAHLSEEVRIKLLNLWEKRLSRSEDNYLASSQNREHFFTLHTLKALAKSLDAHTSYYSPEEAYELRTALEKQFEGIGVVLREGIEGTRIVGLVKGGPAEKSGEIKEGDLIESINGKSMKEASYETILQRLKGPREEEVILGLKREDPSSEKGIQFKVAIKREKIVMDDVRVQYSAFPFVDGLIGKIDLPGFYEAADGSSCEKDLRNALKQLSSQGKILGLIIDMRENSGGFLNQAVKVGELFISSGVIVISKYAEGEVQYLRAVNGKTSYSGPLVILTSKASASAAEIVAQALQDYGTAVIVGDERTYGKGSIQYQTVTEESPKAYFKVTVGKYYTVSGKSTQIEGVKADILVPSVYSPFRIGEKFLEYPLPRDQMPPAFIDPLSDIPGRNKQWFQKNYLPYLHQKDSFWQKMLPTLQKNSDHRLKHNEDFILYLKDLETATTFPPEGKWGEEDLQMSEAVKIVQDMILLQQQKLVRN